MMNYALFGGRLSNYSCLTERVKPNASTISPVNAEVEK